jgi:hypothetical protein
MIANLGYTFTIARHDSTIMSRSLIADIAVPILLLLCAPAVLGRSNAARTAGARSAADVGSAEHRELPVK